MRNYPLILVAAGPKGLTEYAGRPWILRQLKAAAVHHCHRVVIVLGSQHADYLRVVPWMAKARRAPVREEGMDVSVTVVDHPELGLLAALQEGARLLSSEKYVGAYVLPVEVPIGAAEVWSHLRMHLTGDVAACVPEHAGKAGYPVLLSHRYAETLRAMPSESRLEVQLRVLPSETLQRFAVEDPSVCMSINSADHWHQVVEAGGLA